MKKIDISLTHQQAAIIEATVASGDYTSAPEVVRTALREFFREDAAPPAEEMAAEIDVMDAEVALGKELLTVEDVRLELAERRPVRGG